jgi:hypothetical protein
MKQTLLIIGLFLSITGFSQEGKVYEVDYQDTIYYTGDSPSGVLELDGDVVYAESGSDIIAPSIPTSIDFLNNTWLDIDGNILGYFKNANAITGGGNILKLKLTGLRSTDSIVVAIGSDLPTITNDDTLRIGENDTIYGVQIYKSGVLWANIPFSEGRLAYSVPDKFYDISGNSRNIIPLNLTSANFSKQDNYFDLMRGYSIGGVCLFSNGDLTDGNGDNLPDGFTKGTTNFTISYPEGGTGYMRLVFAENTGFPYQRCIKITDGFTNQTPSKKFIIKYRYRTYGSYNGLVDPSITTIRFLSNIGYGISFFSDIGGNIYTLMNTGGIWREGIDTIVNNSNAIYLGNDFAIAIGSTGDFVNTYVDIDYIKICPLQIIPKLISSNTDATGDILTVPQSGNSWLLHAADFQFNSTMSVYQKYTYSFEQENGMGISGQKYLVKKTSGTLPSVNTIFTSNGTEKFNSFNSAREVLDSNLLFTNGIPNVLQMINIKSWYPEMAYFSKNTSYSIDKFKLIHGTQFETTINHLADRTEYVKDSTNAKLLVFIQDHFVQMDSFYLYLKPIYDKYNYAPSIAINYIGGTAAQLDSLASLKNSGYDLILHTIEVKYYGDYYKGWNDNSTYYTTQELKDYYARCIELYDSLGYNSNFKIYPGGGFDTLTMQIVPMYFKAGFRVSATTTPIIINTPLYYYKYYRNDRSAYYNNTLVPRSSMNPNYTLHTSRLDQAEAAGGMQIVYYHLETDWTKKYLDNGTENIGGETQGKKFDDYIQYALSNGWRLVTLQELFDIMEYKK